MSALEIIAPVFAMMFLGYCLGWTRFFPPDAARALMRFVWYVAIPALMFKSLAGKGVPDDGEVMSLVGYYVALYAVYLFTIATLLWVFKVKGAENAMLTLTAVFSNGGFIGIPVILSAFGEEGLHILLLILSFHSMTLVPLTTFLVVRDQQSESSALVILFQSFKSVLQSPLILALLAGMTVSIMGWQIPSVIDRFLAMPADAAAPCGLFAAGAALARVRLQGDLVPAFFLSAVKLAILPISVYAFGVYVFHLPTLWVTVATIFASMPTGSVAYSMAENYGLAPRRAASVVLISTGLSMISLSFIVELLR